MPPSPQHADPSSLALLTDLYQLTMSYGYWKLGRAEQEAIFHLFFRRAPFSGGYAISAGLETAIDFLASFQFSRSDIEFLATVTGNDDRPLFEPKFLDYLSNLKLTIDVDAMPEGTAAFGHEPLLRIQGPILQCQLLETPLLNIINFQTLIATKAARIATAARGEPVLEFGLRRAQGIDGALSASRAAYIGGCAATSNVLAGKRFGIPVKGTHAHSWVMSFDDELESFEQYASVLPHNCVFLVDTYDTLDGVRKAVAVGHKLRASGHEMVGIRLDSGDLASLSRQARALLDAAGFPNASIVASNDLDEYAIESLLEKGAKINVWGVGTKLATAFDQPALGGVYKLGALRDRAGNWQHKIKLSEQTIKTSIPGKLQVKRYESDGVFIRDVIDDELDRTDHGGAAFAVDGVTELEPLKGDPDARELLVPILRKGLTIRPNEVLETIRERAAASVNSLTQAAFQTDGQHAVGLAHPLNTRRQAMIRQSGANP